jgi:hypothetical protein
MVEMHDGVAGSELGFAELERRGWGDPRRISPAAEQILRKHFSKKYAF